MCNNKLVSDNVNMQKPFNCKLAHFSLIFYYYIPLLYITIPNVFWRFHGIQKWNIGLNWVKWIGIFFYGDSLRNYWINTGLKVLENVPLFLYLFLSNVCSFLRSFVLLLVFSTHAPSFMKTKRRSNKIIRIDF